MLPSAGPVAGIAAFSEVTGGKACVAAQQFQAKRCRDIEFGAHRSQPATRDEMAFEVHFGTLHTAPYHILTDG